MTPSDGYGSNGLLRQLLAAFLGNLSAFCIGNMLGWTSPVQAELENGTAGVGKLSETQVSWIGSVNFLGAAAGTLAWGWLSDRLGRRRTALIVSIPFALGWVALLLAPTIGLDFAFAAVLIGRILLGLGCSGVIVNMPTFVTEIAEDKVRGRLGSFLMTSLTAGTLYSYIIGTVADYRGLTNSCLIVPVLFAALFFFVPESPVWYISKGLTQEAEKSLLWYRGNNIDVVNDELTKLRHNSKPKEDKPVWTKWKSLWSNKGVSKAMRLSFAFIIGQQLCGILGICTFAVKIFSLDGKDFSPHLAAIVLGSVQLVAAFVSSMLVDKAGRRILLITSFSTMGGSLIFLALYFFLRPDFPLLPVILLSFHVIAYSLGAGPVPFIIMAEIFAPEVRGTAISFIQFFGTILSFISVKIFPTLISMFGPDGCFLFFGAFNMLETVIVLLYVPETKGKPVSWIIQKLEGKIPSNIATEETEVLQTLQT